MSLRITGGALRGRLVRTPPGLAVRPSSGMLRETLFNLIGPGIAGWRFLDLCAGSGAVGIEAISRGAAEVVFVDDHPAAIALIRRNLEGLGIGAGARLLRRGAVRALEELARQGALFDVVFIDPPYDTGIAGACLRSPALGAIIRPRRRVYLQHRRRETLPEVAGWARADERRFGDTVLTTCEREGEQTT